MSSLSQCAHRRILPMWIGARTANSSLVGSGKSGCFCAKPTERTHKVNTKKRKGLRAHSSLVGNNQWICSFSGWKSTLVSQTGLDFGLSGWWGEAYFKHFIFFFLSPLLLYKMTGFRSPNTLRLKPSCSSGRTPDLKPFKSASSVQWIVTLSVSFGIRNRYSRIFFRNCNDIFPRCPHKYAIWLDEVGLVQLHAFLAGALLQLK